MRPKMMTVTAIIAGLPPIRWNHGTGSGVMRRIAVLMAGGMVLSKALTLLVIPAIYALAKGRRMPRRTGAVASGASSGTGFPSRYPNCEGEDHRCDRGHTNPASEKPRL